MNLTVTTQPRLRMSIWNKERGMAKKILISAFFLISLFFYNERIAFAASTDPIINAIDTAAVYVNAAGTAQENIASYATNYINGKIGALGDINAVSKAAKRAQKAKEMKEKLDKAKAKYDSAKEKYDNAKDKINDAKDWVNDKVEKAVEFKNDVQDKINEAKEEYNNIKSDIDDAKAEYEKAKGMVEDAKTAVNDAKETASALKETAGALKDTAGSAISAAQNKVSSAVERTPFSSKSSGEDIVTVPSASISNNSSDISASSPNVMSSSSVPSGGSNEMVVNASPELTQNVGMAEGANVNLSDSMQDLTIPTMSQQSNDLLERANTISSVANKEGVIDGDELKETAGELPNLENMALQELSVNDIKQQAEEIKQEEGSQSKEKLLPQTSISFEQQLMQIEKKNQINSIKTEENKEDVSKKLKDSAVILNKVSDSVSRRRIFGKNLQATTEVIKHE